MVGYRRVGSWAAGSWLLAQQGNAMRWEKGAQLLCAVPHLRDLLQASGCCDRQYKRPV